MSALWLRTFIYYAKSNKRRMAGLLLQGKVQYILSSLITRILATLLFGRGRYTGSFLTASPVLSYSQAWLPACTFDS